MSNKICRVAFVTLLVLAIADTKKTRRIKNTTPEEDSSPQPSVVSYSTFGFNDVGSYDGFVPSSPDYVTYLSSVSNQESSPTRLYAPAFPSSVESTGYANNFGSQPQDGQSTGDDTNAQSSTLQFNSGNYFNPDNHNDQNPNMSSEEKYRRVVDEDNNSPVYGTKLSANKNRHKQFHQFNDTASFNVYSSGPSNPSENKYSNFKDTETNYDNKPISYGESANSQLNIYNYAPTYPPTETDEEIKPTSNYSINYPKVIDFTKYKQYYPTDIDIKFPSVTVKPITNKPEDNKQTNNYESHINFNYPSPKFKNTYEVTEEDQEKDDPKTLTYTHQDYSNNFVSYNNPKTNFKGGKPFLDYKDKVKNSWVSSTQNSSKNMRNSMKGYDYSTDYSNMSFKYDISPSRKPYKSHDEELTPASSNTLDLSSYKFPETEYTSFKKIPGVKAHYDDEYPGVQSKYKDLFKTDDYINQFKNLYSKNPTTSSLWGNVYKGPEFSSLKHHPTKSPFSEDFTSDIVHIPKKTKSHKFSSGKYSDKKPIDWFVPNKHRPYKSNKPNDWTKDVSLTRFKSEEDLLGLRTHDTSHPSYLPSYKPFTDVFDEVDYKKLVEKWKQSYLKSKYKEALRDFDVYASDSKPVHVPVPKPYAIEVPRPVLVPVPQPYPVRVPIPKPVAVPIVKELTVQIEKPVPYPVYKNVPYPVEKPVPVPVEKQVPVPVIKPYPVAVPHVKPVFHHTRPSHDEYSEEATEEDDDYMPRPEGHRTSKKVPYSTRPQSTRYRLRRPQRTTYQDRNRRRSPERRPYFTRGRPNFEDQEYERSDYYLHCKRTGNC